MIDEILGAISIFVSFLAVWIALLLVAGIPEGVPLLIRTMSARRAAIAQRPSKQPTAQSKATQTALDDLESLRRELSDALAVDVKDVSEHRCTFHAIHRSEGRIILKVDEETDKRIQSSIEAVKEMPDAAGKLVWATRKRDDSSWDLLLVLAWGVRDHAVANVINWVDYNDSEGVRTWLADQMDPRQDNVNPLGTMPPIGLWDGSTPIDGNIVTFNFGTAIATPWALGPAFRAIVGVRVGVPAIVDKREFQAPVGELRIDRLEPDVFRSAVAGDLHA